MRRAAASAFCALALVASGCGTLYNHEVGPCPKSRPDTFRLYGGVRKDLESAAACMATSANPLTPAAERAGAFGGALVYPSL